MKEHPNKTNLEQIRKVETMIAYANSQGITVWIHPWWSRERLNERVSEEQMRRWWRYVIARLGAYNVIWTLAGEYNNRNIRLHSAARFPETPTCFMCDTAAG